MAVEVFGLLDGEMNPLQQKDVATLTSSKARQMWMRSRLSRVEQHYLQAVCVHTTADFIKSAIMPEQA